MSNDEGKIIEGHSYDGIQELDNPLPKWWLATFYITIVFGVGYYAYYEIMGGPSHDEQLNAQMAKIEQLQEQHQAKQQKAAGEIDLATFLQQSEVMDKGKEHFVAKCAACHGQNGEGLIGPNLTDKYWIHSKGKAKGLLAAIRQGFPEKGMPPWDALIPKEDHVALAAYVYSLQGTNPEGGKEPQGELIE